MRLLLLGTDRTLFTSGSTARRRFSILGREYVNELDTIVFSSRRHGITGSQELTPSVHAYPTNSFSRLLYGWDALRIAKKLSRPDVISAQDPFETGLVALFIARYFHIPLSIEIHTDFLSPEYSRHSLLNRLRLMIAGFVLKRAAGGYAVSERVREAVVKKYDLHIPFKILPIFVDLSKFRTLPRMPKKGNLLWVGRLATEKNPATAIKALAAARAADHEAQLTILGAGPLENPLHSLVKKLGVEKSVVFAGWKDPAEFLPEAELVLATSSYEGYGMSIVEALAAGVPVLSTDVGIAREAGATIAEGDFSKALNAWLDSPISSVELKMQSYTNEGEYFSAIQEFYHSLVIKIVF